MLFSSYLYALSYAKGSFRMFLTFVTGRHGGDGYVILGWLIFISIFMSCKDDMDFIWTWTKIWTLLDRIPMIYSISNVFDFNIRLKNPIVLLYFWHQTSWCYLLEIAAWTMRHGNFNGSETQLTEMAKTIINISILFYQLFQLLKPLYSIIKPWIWILKSLRTLKNKKYRTLNQNKSYLN